MNKGNYGFSLPPNVATRIAPPEWRRVKTFFAAGVFSTEIVPQNVFQLLVLVFGGGGGGGGGFTGAGYSGAGGGGGGFASGIIDVVPGQLLPAITVGAGGAGGIDAYNGVTGNTSSFGSILTASGGVGGAASSATNAAGGVGFASPTLRGATTFSGGTGGAGDHSSGSGTHTGGGGAPGSLFGNGLPGAQGASHYGGSLPMVSSKIGPISFLDFVSCNVSVLYDGLIQIGVGATTDGTGAVFFAGGAGQNANLVGTINGQAGGGGGGYGGGMSGGHGAVIMAWSEGY